MNTSFTTYIKFSPEPLRRSLLIGCVLYITSVKEVTEEAVHDICYPQGTFNTSLLASKVIIEAKKIHQAFFKLYLIKPVLRGHLWDKQKVAF